MRRLEIEFEGEAKGLDTHRLSISEFAGPLGKLLKALRRVATRVAREAAGRIDRDEVGRHAEIARWLDLELEGIREGSLSIPTVITFNPPPDLLPIYEPLADRAVGELMTALDEESKGRPYNKWVRDYLASLPREITSQRYYYQNGTGTREVAISSMELSDVPAGLPYLFEAEGQVVGVGFEPGRPEVKLRLDGKTLILPASASQVEAALRLRGGRCRFLAVLGEVKRLVRLTAVDQAARVLTIEEVRSAVFERWDDLHRRLAR